MTGIVLVGLPGSGKSKLGRILAPELGLAFIDLDAYIEQSSGQTIAQLFERGESHFRDVETRALRDCLEKPDTLIATGGGIVEREQNRELLQDAVTVFLDIEVEDALGRVAGKTHRPLLAGDARAKLDALAQRRRPLYMEVADVTVSVSNLPAPENAQRVLDAIRTRVPKA
ncbi:MAG: shikimate kinase [Actinomycetaceae bacterium]|nr:shikimate kinase [Actinomycetaceae bacterium]